MGFIAAISGIIVASLVVSLIYAKAQKKSEPQEVSNENLVQELKEPVEESASTMQAENVHAKEEIKAKAKESVKEQSTSKKEEPEETEELTLQRKK